MNQKVTRRGFLKAAGISAAATAVLVGCGPASRYVVREPYTHMPEYTYNGQSTYYATTCNECPAGCGIIVRTEQGRALKIEGNPSHPVNQGKTCARGQVALQGLYNPDRIQHPVKQNGRGSQNFTTMNWEEAIGIVQDALQRAHPEQVAFFLGTVNDHLFELVSEICSAVGAPPPVRYGAYEVFGAQLTLLKATQQLFSANNLPFFDLTNADVTISFGANFLETYLSPMAYSRAYARMRRGKTGTRGYLVQFEPHLSQTAASADEWIPIIPGSEGVVALALGRLIAELSSKAIPMAYLSVDIDQAAKASGISVTDLQRLASLLHNASNPLAIPGGSAMGASSGLESAKAILSLNVLLDNLGKAGGLFISPDAAIKPELPQSPNSFVDIYNLIQRMDRGEVETLLIHGVNPAFELPAGSDFQNALTNVPQVVSFASYPDETSQFADFIFPDHTGLESWGYKRISTGADKKVVSGSQPVVVPFYDTQSTSDILLAAVQGIGGNLAEKLPYKDTVEYMQNSLVDLVGQAGFYRASEIVTFMASFQQYGGWWGAMSELQVPKGDSALTIPIASQAGKFEGEGDYYLFLYMSPILGDGAGANKPWLQEIPDPTTTVMWNSWVEINPLTADQLGIQDDDLVRIISPVGEIEAVVYRYPAIRPDTIAIPFGQGHTAYGRYAQSRGVNPIGLLNLAINGADDLSFVATRVRIEKVGKKQPLSRLESRMGVYGE